MSYTYTRETLVELGYTNCEDTQLPLVVETLMGYHLARKYRDQAITLNEAESERYWDGNCDAYRVVLNSITGETLKTTWQGMEPYYHLGGAVYTFATCEVGNNVWYKRLF